MTGSGLRRRVVGALVSCFCAVSSAAVCDASGRDWGFETFGIALPSPAVVTASAVPTHIVRQHAVGALRLPMLLAAADFTAAQALWDQAAALPRKEQQTREMERLLSSMHGRNLMLVGRAEQWVVSHPDSYAARITLAGAYVGAAWEARGHGDARSVPRAQFHWARSRLSRAEKHLVTLKALPGFPSVAADHLAIKAGMLDRRWDSWAALKSMLAYAPLDEGLYFMAAELAHPRWAGERAQALERTVLDWAVRNGLSDPHLTALKQKLDEARNPPQRISNPAQVRPYWEARVARAPTLSNLADWLEAEYALKNWPLVLEITARINRLSPTHPRVWEVRAWALKEMDEPEAAYEAAVASATVGNDGSMNLIIQGYVRGGLKRPLRDFNGLLAHCQMGSALALPSAANCMGSAYSEGFGGTRTDLRTSLAWHLLGARGGVANSAHDVAVLLPKVVRDPALLADVQAAAGYWLQVAARTGHQQARNKLADQPGLGEVCDSVLSTSR